MRYKATFIAGFAVGFLAGARAGRGAYDKIAGLSQKVASNPKVQETASAAQAKATDLAKTAAAKAPDVAKSAAKTAQEQASHVPEYASNAKQAVQSKMPGRLGGSGDTVPGDVTADGSLIYPADEGGPTVNGSRYDNS